MKYLKFSIDNLIDVIQALILKSVIRKNDLTAKKYDECNLTLKNICSDNVIKIIFAHLNTNSIRNKSEF